MSQTHIHLLITHLPIFGSILGAFVLALGLLTKSDSTKIAAYNVFIISAIGGGIGYFTGEGAEEGVEHLPGIVEQTIKLHQQFALFALISLIALGAASILGLFLTMTKSKWTKTAAFTILLISLVSFGLGARTGYLGGQIRHTEINSSTSPNPTENNKEGDKD